MCKKQVYFGLMTSLFLMSLSPLAFSAHTIWKWFQFSQGNFRIQLPERPQVRSNEITSQSAGLTYKIFFDQKPEGYDVRIAEDLMQERKNAHLAQYEEAGSKVRLEETVNTQLNQFPVQEFRFIKSDGEKEEAVIYRVMWTPQRIYEFEISRDGYKYASYEDAGKFFRSFKLIR
ncbi:MAG: hypothetical protein AAFU64_16695 [Bacteroidota bacterium]